MAELPESKRNRSKGNDASLTPAARDKGNAPADTLALLRNWLGAAKSVVEHIGAMRGNQVVYYHLDPVPWPLDAIEFLDRNSPQVIEYLKRRHALDVRTPVERISHAAKAWAEKRGRVVRSAGSGPPTPEVTHELSRFTEADLPEQRRLELDLRIVEGSCWHAFFPLVAGDKGETDTFRVRRLLVRWAVWVADALAETIKAWPPPDEHIATATPNDRSCGVENPERWELANVILPRYVLDTDDTPIKLAIAEARQVGDLAVALPRIERIEPEIAAFLREAVDWPQGNARPSRTVILGHTVSELEKMVGSNGPLTTSETHELDASNPELSLLRFECLLAVYDWEHARFECMRGDKPLGLRFRLTPVPLDLILLLVWGRIGTPGELPKQKFSIEAELSALVRLGVLERVSTSAVKAVHFGHTLGVQEACQAVGFAGNPDDLPAVDFRALFNASAPLDVISGAFQSGRWRFDDGCDVGFIDYPDAAKTKATRNYKIYSRTIMVPARNSDGAPVKTRSGIKMVPGPDGWRTTRERNAPTPYYAITKQGHCKVERTLRDRIGEDAPGHKVVPSGGPFELAGPRKSEPAAHLKPCQLKAMNLHNWAMENVEGAEKMTYAQLFDTLFDDPRCGGEGLPSSSGTFGRYCRAAGIQRNTPRAARGLTRSIRRASEK